MYHSTRNKDKFIPASMAILEGLAKDGGLYVPEEIPKIDIRAKGLANTDYRNLAKKILALYLDDFSVEQVSDCVDRAYASTFSAPEICPLKRIGDKYYLELFHGKTLAFKDVALSILPELMRTSAEIQGVNKRILILTATSGDTGKAALEGFSDREGMDIIVYYPTGGVSEMQKRQMTTQEGENVIVYGVDGNFDDCQSAVKTVFNDAAFGEDLLEKGYILSSANSINIGRLIPQIVYYFYAYFQIVNMGDIELGSQINFCVPTGNFGNILAAYYAKEMGLPINKLICASNKNKVLTDFFRNGLYTTRRRFYATTSPSMDILISSNFERMLYYACDEDSGKVTEYMDRLREKGKYDVGMDVLANLDTFRAEYANEAQTNLSIFNVFKENAYLIDTHTAVAEYAYSKYREKSVDKLPCIIVSTASPFKFPESVLSAIETKDEGEDAKTALDAFEALRKLSEISGSIIPKQVLELEDKALRFDKIIAPADILDSVKKYIDSRSR